MVEVIQSDREAAADFMEHKCLPGDLTPTNIRLGNLDDGFAVQAFASHRQQAERGEVVAWMYVRGEHRVVVPLSERASHMTEHGWTETPLYTIPTPPEAV